MRSIAETPAEQGLALRVRYEGLDGSEIDLAKLDQGTDIKAIVSVQHIGSQGRVDNLALAALFAC